MAKVAWTVKALVWRALNNAVENGYTFQNGVNGGYDLEEMATDLLTYDSELEGMTPRELRPHIQSWINISAEARKTYPKTFEDRQKKLDQENQASSSKSQEPAKRNTRWVICNAVHEGGSAMPNLFMSSFSTFEQAFNHVVDGELEMLKAEFEDDAPEQILSGKTWDEEEERSKLISRIEVTKVSLEHNQYLFTLGDYTWLIGEVTI